MKQELHYAKFVKKSESLIRKCL